MNKFGRGQALSVTELTNYIKDIFAADPLLNRLRVSGEISNFKYHSSEHMYFTLKDAGSALRCVMFRSANQRLTFRPADGMKVTAGGRLAVFERDGQYQLYADSLVPEGVGSLFAAFQDLKHRLAAEGLFDTALKQKLPLLPARIGLVTSPAGAAVRDFLTTAVRRFPTAEILIVPVLVQGPEAPGQIERALQFINTVPGVEVVVLARGGGSIEELWAFNAEPVARAIFASGIPVVSAIGHETDFTIADFAADVRAATPTAAAELVVPDRRELDRRLAVSAGRLSSHLVRRLREDRRYLDKLATSRVLVRPAERLLQYSQHLDGLLSRLSGQIDYRRQNCQARLDTLEGKLAALNPGAVLARGFALCLDSGGRIIREAAAVSSGDAIEVRLGKGALEATVGRIRGGE